MQKPKTIYIDSKSALCNAEEGDNIHLAWENPFIEGAVLSIERIPANWPSATMVSEPWRDYLESIKDYDWIVAGLDISRFSEAFGVSEEEIKKILGLK